MSRDLEDGSAEAKYQTISDPENDLSALSHLNAGRERHLLRALYENSPVGVFYSPEIGQPGFANPTFRRLFGIEDPEPFKIDLKGLIHPDDLEDSLLSIERLKNESRRNSCIRRMLRSDGSTFHARVDIYLLPPSQDNEGMIILMVSDISDELDQIEDLRHSRQLNKMHMEQTLVGEIEMDTKGRVVSWNPAAEKLFAYSKEEALGRMGVKMIVSAHERRSAQKILRKVVETRQPTLHVQDHVTRDGRRMTCEWYVTPLTDSDGDYAGVAALFLDVTEPVSARRAAEENEKKLHQIVESLTVPVIIRREEDERVLFINKPFYQLAGLPDDRPIDEIHVGCVLDRKAREEVDRHFEEKGELSQYKVESVIRGVRHILLVSMRAMEIQGQPARMTTLLDVTALHESREEARTLAAVVEATQDFIGITNMRGRPQYVNRAGRELVGISPDVDVQRLRLTDFHPPEYTRKVRKMWRDVITYGRFEGDFPIRSFATGEDIPTYLQAFIIKDLDTGKNIACAIIAIDLRERRRMEEERLAMEQQMFHAQKVEGLGVLAGGVAHDFNNLLMTMLGNVSLALAEEKLPPGLSQYLENIEQSARHASDLTSQLLTYSGKAAIRALKTDLVEIIREMENLLRSAVGRKAELAFSYGALQASIEADPTQIRQVIMNLVVNAADAILDKDQGIGNIDVRITRSELNIGDTRNIVSAKPLKPGAYFILEVEDNGIGMDPATRERIFEPFYTTKYSGRGLGLASVFGIMKGHQGGIFVESKRRQGTTFRLYFPACQGEVEEHPGEGSKDMDNWVGNGTVLVVDDEEPVRYVCKMILEQRGLSVLTAVNGHDAIDVYKENHDKVDIVLLDMMMPQMSGDETLKLLRELDDSVRVILSSGFSEGDISSEMDIQPNAFIQKPYLPDDLVATVREVLEKGQAQKSP